jgi:hypothetical protein
VHTRRHSFRVYAPLLSQIKAAYDSAIDLRMQHLFHVQPKVVKLDALRNGYDLNLQAIYDQHEEVCDHVDTPMHTITGVACGLRRCTR